MVQTPLRTNVRGPTFIRLLAGLAEACVPQSNPSLPEQLSQWIDWTRAVALSGALDGRLPVADADAPEGDEVEAQECARSRASLANAIAGMGSSDTGTDYTVFRQRCLDMQWAMQAATGRLRGRLRDCLARRSTDMARLAEVDAVMEQALSPREQKLLAVVPALLGQHFERLRQSAQATAEAQAAAGIPTTHPEAWLAGFRRDMRGVLLAELEVRFHPIEGLLAALRSH